MHVHLENFRGIEPAIAGEGPVRVAAVGDIGVGADAGIDSAKSPIFWIARV